MSTVLETERLLLRDWSDDDREDFARINADPEVMAHFPSVLTRTQTDAFVDKLMARFDAQDFGFCAVERKADGALLGFTGLCRPPFEAHFTPCIEIGWRLGRPYWGKGYATEAAHASLRYGFDECGLEEVVAITVPANLRSRAVMERLGMQRDVAGDFEHPMIELGSPFRSHVLYRLKAADWRSAQRLA